MEPLELNGVTFNKVVAYNKIFETIIERSSTNYLLVTEKWIVVSFHPKLGENFRIRHGIKLQIGESIIDSMHFAGQTELARKWTQCLSKVVASGPHKINDVYEMEGRRHHWEVYFDLISVDGDRMISITSRDVSTSKIYQKKNLQNEVNLRVILNSTDSGTWLINENFELVEFNSSFLIGWRTLFGTEIFRGMNVLEAIPSNNEWRQTWAQRYAQCLCTGKQLHYFDTLEFGEELMFEIKIVPILQDGLVKGIATFANNRTKINQFKSQLKLQNEELIKLNLELVKANDELDLFVYSASHDLRAPLTSITGLLNMIKVDNEPANVKSYLELIEKSATRLDNFISDIIHYSYNSRMELRLKEVNFSELADGALEALRYIDGAEAVRCIKNIRVTDAFYSDPSRLSIIFNNIISNAVKYKNNAKADSYLQIDITADSKNAYLQFADNGIGIASEFIDKIFNMFYRASSESKGSGLGLYIVKNAVQKLQGDINVESSLGEWTVFKIRIPNLKFQASTSKD